MLIETFGVVGNSDRPSFVRVELRIERGFLFRLSGLSTTAAKAAQTRIRSALLACGNRWPGKGISVNIAPATELRNTTELDLPIALALLAAQGVIAPSTIKSTAFSGELSLDGSVVNSPKNDQLIISKEINDREKLKINSIFNSNGLHLKKILSILQTYSPPANTTLFQNNRIIQINRNLNSDVFQSNNCAKRTLKTEIKTKLKTFLNLKGEHTAKRQALIAAAGRHNTIIIGPPGSGKSTLAKIIHSLLPDIKSNDHQNQEGLNESTRPPWRAPHTTTKPAGLIGSWKSNGINGSEKIILGEWSLAHQGVLFMDERPEFSRDSLEACRVPMETGQIALARASGSTILDASPLVIAALNPCPCGKHTSKSAKCFCSPSEARAYVGKLSGPIADRFAIHLEMGEEVVNMAKVDDFSRFLEKSDDKRGIIDENGVKTSKK